VDDHDLSQITLRFTPASGVRLVLLLVAAAGLGGALGKQERLMSSRKPMTIARELPGHLICKTHQDVCLLSLNDNIWGYFERVVIRPSFNNN
jgi:hypothetical protein